MIRRTLPSPGGVCAHTLHDRHVDSKFNLCAARLRPVSDRCGLPSGTESSPTRWGGGTTHAKVRLVMNGRSAKRESEMPGRDAHGSHQGKSMPASSEADVTGPRGRTVLWADRLAERRRRIHQPSIRSESPADEWVPGANDALWRLFDNAVTQATSALQRAGLTERILTRVTSREYWLSMDGPCGEPRRISLFVSLRSVEGHASGGAQITTSQTRANIFLVPSIAGGRLRWWVTAASKEFTARVVDDLLLSVFTDDPSSTARLAAYFDIGDTR